MKIILSIIIPVYNVEEYILELLTSLHCQLNENVEVIIIDDGSTDNSIGKVEGFIQKNKILNLTIIKTINKGLSAARNLGIIKSKGDYITFIDSDDYVNSNYIEIIIANIFNDIDILTFNASIVSINGQHLRDLIVVESNSTCKDKIVYEVFNSGMWYAWCRVYKKEILKKNFFLEGKRFEDLLSIPALYLDCTSLKSINDNLVCYRTNPYGITSNSNIKDLNNLKENCDFYKKTVSSFPSKENILLYLTSLKALFFVSINVLGFYKSYIFMIPYMKFNSKLKSQLGNIGEVGLSKKNRIFISNMSTYFVLNFFKVYLSKFCSKIKNEKNERS